ncbi:PTS sugar transporter subunit IIA [Opitutaceae bacterium TAV4]|uniref:PTS sugar transporter subunit IIA n=1 Tax=Geminisphaera colitermitum TaxID=1148786 RepID=UPI000196531F|nr:PTS sugar transporter subunit IIA [Geminisphaera colitermitum]RRJ94522.1 PTS sugar transporter subunit IIA [Opitutaceae bacterium TAV4]RRK01019.1 PTS sugar transporter subunit IIA [Opitutaceae bacterium TAV3]RRK01217.1 PTS sugar transporter subunit IIA [Opitutaceae bacterium TAV3]
MYLNLIQIAESFGVSEKVVEDWIKHDGLPITPDRGRLLFDRTQVANWATARGLAARTGFLAPANPSLATALRLEPLLRAGRIWRDVAAAGLTRVIDQIVGGLPGVTPPIRQLLLQRLHAKGGITFAPVGGGFAIPHPTTRIALGRDSGTLALVLLREPLVLDEPTPDGMPVTRLFFFIAPSPRTHLDLLGRLCRLIARGPLRDAVEHAAPDETIFAVLAAADAAAAIGNANPQK